MVTRYYRSTMLLTEVMNHFPESYHLQIHSVGLRRAVRDVLLGGENSFVSKTDLGACQGCCQTCCCCRGAVAPLEDDVPVAAGGGGSNGFGL